MCAEFGFSWALPTPAADILHVEMALEGDESETKGL